MPHEFVLLEDLLILLLASVPIAFLSNRLRQPTIVGFMITGVLIGPHGLRLIRDVEAVDAMAEIGVALLLFVIGLEFSLKRILDMRRIVFWGGGLQVTVTAVVVAGLFYWMTWQVNHAIFFGFLVALSSTAIVLKSYQERAELDTLHGRAGLGILLFQDLCVIPMMLLLPVLSGKQGTSPLNVLTTLGTALAAVAAIIFVARIVMPRALFQVVRIRSQEVFVIFIVLVVLGTSWLTSQLGLSLALGAFIAGIVISESEYSHQIVADVLPFRDVFNGVFFISIGMLLSSRFLLDNLGTVLVLVAAVVLCKVGILLFVGRVLGQSLRVALMTALGLGQVGEFSFILAKVGIADGLMTDTEYQKFLAAAIITMIMTPFLIRWAPRVGYAVQSMLDRKISDGEPSMRGFEPHREDYAGHVVIVGYGLNGRNLAGVLRRVKIPYLILDLNAEAVRAAGEEGEPVLYGDASRREVLHSVFIERARIMVIAISDPIATRHALWQARQMNPDIHIIVRTRYMSEVPDLFKLGANDVIPEEFETSIEIFSRVLSEYGVSRNAIQHEVEEIRRSGYEMLRTPSLPLLESKAISEALQTASTETLFIRADAYAIGRTLGELNLRRHTGATVIATIREDRTEINPGPDFVFQEGDIVVLMGGPEQIELASECIASGEAAASRAGGKDSEGGRAGVTRQAGADDTTRQT